MHFTKLVKRNYLPNKLQQLQQKTATLESSGERRISKLEFTLTGHYLKCPVVTQYISHENKTRKHNPQIREKCTEYKMSRRKPKR